MMSISTKVIWKIVLPKSPDQSLPVYMSTRRLHPVPKMNTASSRISYCRTLLPSGAN